MSWLHSLLLIVEFLWFNVVNFLVNLFVRFYFIIAQTDGRAQYKMRNLFENCINMSKMHFGVGKLVQLCYNDSSSVHSIYGNTAQ